jgi:malonyl-CoA/methylmalonyl-CoA synthetase
MDHNGAACAPGVVGSVEVDGPNVFTGYWQMPEKTREEFTPDGWFRTGDVGEWVATGEGTGHLRLAGRAKDLIITGGLNVYPKEVEDLIDALPGVVESAVIGVPDPDFGEAVTAVVVIAEGHRFDERAVIAALRRDIAAFKVPKRVHVVAELPRNAMGKVQKNVLRERFATLGSEK